MGSIDHWPHLRTSESNCENKTLLRKFTTHPAVNHREGYRILFRGLWFYFRDKDIRLDNLWGEFEVTWPFNLCNRVIVKTQTVLDATSALIVSDKSFQVQLKCCMSHDIWSSQNLSWHTRTAWLQKVWEFERIKLKSLNRKIQLWSWVCRVHCIVGKSLSVTKFDERTTSCSRKLRRRDDNRAQHRRSLQKSVSGWGEPIHIPLCVLGGDNLSPSHRIDFEVIITSSHRLLCTLVLRTCSAYLPFPFFRRQYCNDEDETRQGYWDTRAMRVVRINLKRQNENNGDDDDRRSSAVHGLSPVHQRSFLDTNPCVPESPIRWDVRWTTRGWRPTSTVTTMQQWCTISKSEVHDQWQDDCKTNGMVGRGPESCQQPTGWYVDV